MRKTHAVTSISQALGLAAVLGFGLISLSGCAASSTFQDPAYTRKELQSEPVGFMAMRYTEVGMAAYEEFRKAFKKEEESGGEKKLAEAFNKAFLTNAKSKVPNFTVLDSGPALDPYKQYEAKLLLNKGKKSQSAMRIYLPTKSTIDSLNPPVRFIVTARNVNFSYKEDLQPGTYAPGGKVSTPGGAFSTPGTMTGGGKSKIITLSMSYAIWDYRKDAPVAYGKYTTDMSAKFFFTQGEWLGMMDRAARELAFRLP